MKPTYHGLMCVDIANGAGKHAQVVGLQRVSRFAKVSSWVRRGMEEEQLADDFRPSSFTWAKLSTPSALPLPSVRYCFCTCASSVSTEDSEE